MVNKLGDLPKQIKKHLILIKDIRKYVKNKEIVGITVKNTTKLEIIKFVQKVVDDLDGNIYITGRDIKNRYRKELEPTKKMMENVEIRKDLTGMENLEIALKKKRKELTEEINKYLEILNLSKIIHEKTSEYNKVELQNLDIMRAIIYEAKIIILDEPECCENKEDQKAFRETLKNLISNSDIIIFFVADENEKLIHTCNKIVQLEKAKIDKIHILGTFDEIEEREKSKN